MDNQHDVQIVRDLARQYAELAALPIQEERRRLWRDHNSFIRTRPLIYCSWLAAWQEHPDAKPHCEDPFYRAHETFLKQRIFQQTLGDDCILEPWIVQRASVTCPPGGVWGVPYGRISSGVPGGAWKNDPPLKDVEDVKRLVKPHHVIDEQATARNVSRLRDAVGDILEVAVDRSPLYMGWHADLSTDLIYLREIGQVMLDMSDNPQWLHELLAFMRDGVLAAQQEAENAGDYSLINHSNQAMTYAHELPDPKPNSFGVNRNQLWGFCAAQEYALVSPRMHDEFLLQYQLPIISQYGLSAYGCCEDLTNKIDMLRQIPNLRRIAVTPAANVARCAEQIGADYILSWRPNPSQMMCCGFDPALIRKVVGDAMEASRGCHVDIILKDVQTVGGQPELLRDWVRIVRDITDKY